MEMSIDDAVLTFFTPFAKLVVRSVNPEILIMPRQQPRRRNRSRARNQIVEPEPLDDEDFIRPFDPRNNSPRPPYIRESPCWFFLRCLACFFIIIAIGFVSYNCYEIYIKTNTGDVNWKENNDMTMVENNQAMEHDETKIDYLASKISNLEDEISTLKERLKQTDKLLKSTRNQVAELTTNSRNSENAIDRRIEKAIMTYDADKIGIFDYAAEYASGSIVSTPNTEPYPINQTTEVLGFFIIDKLSQPVAVIQPGSLPGECFVFHGAEGYITIKLVKRIVITHVTLEHVSHLLEQDQSSAPRDFEVLAWNDMDTTTPTTSLGKFSYKTEIGETRQTFKVNKSVNEAFSYVLLHILNNHGNEEYTCVYRFRVHSVDD